MKSKLIKINKNYCNFLKNKINNSYFNGKANIENLAFALKIAKSFIDFKG